MIDKQQIAIVVCFYNNEDTLLKSLQSLQAQSYGQFICYLIDDGSNDGSSQIARSFCDLDDRFCYFHKEHSGPGASRNMALELIEQSKFRYLSFLDADDFIAINKLEIQVQQLQKENEVALVACVSKDYPLHQYMQMEFNEVREFKATKYPNSFFELLTDNFKFHPASSLIDLFRINTIPRNTTDVSGQDYKFFLDIFYQNPNKIVLDGDFYTASVRTNSVQRKTDAKLKSAVARYNAALFYKNRFCDRQSNEQVNYAIDKYLGWISYQTQIYQGYTAGIKQCINQFPLYVRNKNFLIDCLRRVLYVFKKINKGNK